MRKPKTTRERRLQNLHARCWHVDSAKTKEMMTLKSFQQGAQIEDDVTMVVIKINLDSGGIESTNRAYASERSDPKTLG